MTSKNCHALTAVHCLVDSLDKAGHVRWVQQGEDSSLRTGWINKNPKEISVKLREFSVLPSTDGKDHVVRDGSFLNWSESEVKRHVDSIRKENVGLIGPMTHLIRNNNAQLIAVGHGFFSKAMSFVNGPDAKPIDDNELENHFRHMRETRSGVLADYAMVKLPGQNCTCVKTGKSDGQKMVVVGYPGTTAMQIVNGGLPGTSRESSLSVGQRCEPSVRNTRAIIATLAPLERFVVNLYSSHLLSKREFVLKMESKILKGQLITHTGVSSPGVSGGALLDDKMNLIEINTMGGNVDFEMDRFSRALAIEYIHQELKRDLSAEDYASAFECP